jgi:hypothetical protein
MKKYQYRIDSTEVLLIGDYHTYDSEDPLVKDLQNELSLFEPDAIGLESVCTGIPFSLEARVNLHPLKSSLRI